MSSILNRTSAFSNLSEISKSSIEDNYIFSTNTLSSVTYFTPLSLSSLTVRLNSKIFCVILPTELLYYLYFFHTNHAL